MAATLCSTLAPTELEREHVHKVYDLIAPHFSHTRHHPWPQVTTFLEGLEPGALVADIGCGNGKYLDVNPSLCMIGGDRSIPLMQTAGSSDCNLLGCDALKVPLRTGAFDAALSIAVLHHISTEERRVALISELARLVRVGGDVLIVAWAFEQDERSKRRFEQQDVMVEWKLQRKYAHEEDDDSASNSHGRVDQEKRWVVYERYCHVYRSGELEALVGQVSGLQLVAVEYCRSNCMTVDGADASINALEVSPSEDEESGGPDENDDANDGSDTSRVVESATSYARDCLKVENYTEASIALRSVLEIANPSSAPFKLTALHIAQLLKVTLQLEASIDCMLSIYRSMPSPFTHIDGVCIIARLYEQLESMNAANFWWKKVAASSSSSVYNSSARPNALVWEALGDRLFERELFAFAADFYGQVFETLSGDLFAPSNRLRYRYLTALLAFVGPSGATAHRNLCSSVAWSLAQWFRRHSRRGPSHFSACYGDPHFYRMRGVYLASFPAIYRVVFAWVDGPAGRIARWWRRQWARRHPPVIRTTGLSAIQRTKRKTKKNNMRRTAASSPDHQQHTQSRSFLRRKVYAPLPISPSRSRKPQEILQKKIKKTGDSSNESMVEKRTDTLTRDRANATNATQLNNDAASCEEPQWCQGMTGRNTKSPPRMRSKGRSRRLQTKQLGIDGDDDPTTEEAMRQATLLDVYPLQVSRTEDFVAACGREPSFADLNLAEVGEFARLAHYRARVLTDKHARVASMDPDRVKPRWLQELEKAVALVETQQQRNLLSGKVVADGDSITHLSEVHTRLVLSISTLCRRYTRDFGETSFTRRLQGLTRRLIAWKLSRISDVVAALIDAKDIATHEEKQRNLEFYHVHRDVKEKESGS